MTYEEAISSLETLKPIVEWGKPMEYQVALDLGIEALEKAERYKWHDLRKDPTDLPDDGRLVDCRTTDKQPFYYGNYDSEFGTWYDSEGFSMQVVAWREVEPFESEV